MMLEQWSTRSREILGMVLMAICGFGCSFGVIMTTIIDRLDVSYYPLVGFVGGSISLVLLAGLHLSGELASLPPDQWRLIWMRGALGMSTYISSILAAAAGAPLGDVSALGSSNIVVAAILGAIILGEKLKAVHVTVMLFSIIGAVLISQPETFLNGSDDGDRPWLGYALALLSGALSGSLFIALRKSASINPLILTCSVMLQEGICMSLLPWTGLVSDKPLDRILIRPGRTAALALVTGVNLFAACICTSAGAQLCPARISSTISTCVSMTLSYVAQVALHGQQPSAQTITGALLMTAAVGVMAATPSRSKPAVGCEQAEDGINDADPDKIHSSSVAKVQQSSPVSGGGDHHRHRPQAGEMSTADTSRVVGSVTNNALVHLAAAEP